MKNKLPLLGITLLCLTGCENAPKKDKENNNNNSENNNKTPESKPDEGTPQWWLDMLTCNNVTIQDTHKTLGTEVIYFKYVEGKVYKKGPSDDSYAPYLDSTFDLLLEYRNSYQTFKRKNLLL